MTSVLAQQEILSAAGSTESFLYRERRPYVRPQQLPGFSSYPWETREQDATSLNGIDLWHEADQVRLADVIHLQSMGVVLVPEGKPDIIGAKFNRTGLQEYVCAGRSGMGQQAFVCIETEPDAAALPSVRIPADSVEDFIKENLAEIDVDDLDEGESLPTREAKDACVRLARQLAGTLCFDPTLRVAAFNGENGGVSLVAQSIITDRRVSIDIAADGQVAEVITVDETCEVATNRLTTNNSVRFGELALWLVTSHQIKQQAIAGSSVG